MREGREGREREGERDRERGSRAKPGIQLVYYISEIDKQAKNGKKICKRKLHIVGRKGKLKLSQQYTL